MMQLKNLPSVGGMIWYPWEICSARSKPTIFLSAMKRKTLVRSGARMPTSEKPRSLYVQNYYHWSLMTVIWKNTHNNVQMYTKLCFNEVAERCLVWRTYQQFPRHLLSFSTTVRRHQAYKVGIELASEKLSWRRSDFSPGLKGGPSTSSRIVF